MKNPGKYQQQDGIQSCQASDEDALDFQLPIVAKESDDEEWDVDRNEYGDGSPSGINTNKGRHFHEEDLHHGKEGGI